MAPPRTRTGSSRKRGFQPPGAIQLDPKTMGGPALAGLAAFCLVVSVLCFTLKSQLVKPNRILDAAEDSGLYGKLPRLLFEQVTDGPLRALKALKLSEAEKTAMAEKVFDPDWAAQQLENLVIEAADEIRSPSGGRLQMALDLSEIKAPLASAIADAVERKADTVPACGGAKRPSGQLCRPTGVDDYTFAAGIRDEVRKVVNDMPSSFSLMSDQTAQALTALQGTLGTLGTVATALLLLALGLGAGAFLLTTKAQQEPPIGPAGVGLVAGGVLLFMVIMGTRKAIAAGLGAATAALAAPTRDSLNAFLDGAVGGGFTVATWVVLGALALGAGLVYLGFFAKQ